MRDQEKNGGRNREPRTARHENGRPINSVYLFGDFQIFSRTGEEMVQRLPPKVQELFLMMLTSSFKPFSYITNKSINSHLWPDLSLEQAKNNRSVSVNKLRSVLEDVDGITICCDKAMWWVELDNQIYCDYQRLLSILSSRNLTHAALSELNMILSRGEFMKEHDYDWFETGRMRITDAALHKLKEHLLKQKEDSPNRALIAESILHLDPLSESALKVKIQFLVRDGEHTLARATFEHFRKEFQRIYGTELKKTFNDMLK